MSEVRILAATGMVYPLYYDDEQTIWTPNDSPSFLNSIQARKLFPDQYGYLGFLGEVKDVGAWNQSSIISVDAFRELKEFNDGVFDIVTRIDEDQVSGVSVKNLLDEARGEYNFLVHNENREDLEQSE